MSKRPQRPTAANLPALLDGLLVNVDGTDYLIRTSAAVPPGECHLEHPPKRPTLTVSTADPARQAVALLLAAVAQAAVTSVPVEVITTKWVTPRYWRRT